MAERAASAVFRARPALFSSGLIIGVALFGHACRCGDPDVTASVDAPPSATPPRFVAKPLRSVWPLPGGPQLAVLAGQGVGPIRLGATVETVERHMGEKCEIKTPELCRMIARAIEFEFTDGVLSSIRAYRMDRPAGNDATGQPRTYGMFNGAIPPDLRFGMLPSAMAEHLGKPQRIEKTAADGGLSTETHYYPGLVLEYDLLENGNLALGVIRVVKR